MGEQDTRLPELQLGLGVWISEKARFYSMETLKAHNNAIIDTLDQEKLVILWIRLPKCRLHIVAMQFHVLGMATLWFWIPENASATDMSIPQLGKNGESMHRTNNLSAGMPFPINFPTARSLRIRIKM